MARRLDLGQRFRPDPARLTFEVLSLRNSFQRAADPCWRTQQRSISGKISLREIVKKRVATVDPQFA